MPNQRYMKSPIITAMRRSNQYFEVVLQRRFEISGTELAKSVVPGDALALAVTGRVVSMYDDGRILVEVENVMEDKRRPHFARTDAPSISPIP